MFTPRSSFEVGMAQNARPELIPYENDGKGSAAITGKIE
jgi:hypothetical protein